MGISIFIDTHLCTVSKYICKNKKTKRNMSAKQITHKCSLMIKNKYGCQMHSIYACNCWVQSLLACLFYLYVNNTTV